MPTETRTYSCNVCETEFTGEKTAKSFREAEEGALRCESLPFLFSKISSGTVYRAFIPNTETDAIVEDYDGKKRLGYSQERKLEGQGYLIIRDWTGIRDTDEGDDVHIRRYTVAKLSDITVKDAKFYTGGHFADSTIDRRQIKYLMSQRARFSQSHSIPHDATQLMTPTPKELEQVRSSLITITSKPSLMTAFFKHIDEAFVPDFSDLVAG